MKKSKDKFELSAKRSVPCEELSDYAIWIYGAPKIGKTTLADEFPDTYHLLFEDGAKALAIRKTQVREWPTTRKALKAIEADDSIRNFTMDVVEAAYDMCFKHVCDKLGIDYPDELGYGKGWAKIRDEFMGTVMRAIGMPGKGPIFISHAVSGTRKTFDGDEVEDTHPALTGKILEVFSGAMDIIGYYHYRKGERVLQIRGDDNVMAGCRLRDNFRYRDGSPIKYVPLGDSEKEAYENLTAAFRNELSRPEDKGKKRTLRVKSRR